MDQFPPGAWGKMIHEKNLKQKISCHCPFKYKPLNTITGGKSTREKYTTCWRGDTLLKDLCGEKRTQDYVENCHENGGFHIKSEKLENMKRIFHELR